MDAPRSAEGHVWYQQHFQALGAFLASGMRDRAQVADMARSLKFLLEREPDNASLVLRLAVRAVMMTRKFAGPDDVRRIAQIGLDALAIDDRTGTAPLTASALLLLCVAETELGAERRLEGLDALKALETRIAGAPSGAALLSWVRAREQYLRAGLHELGLERLEAYAAFTRAHEATSAVLADAAKKNSFKEEWLDAIFGPTEVTGEARAPFADIALLEVEQICVGAAIGAARTAPAEGRADAVCTAWTAMRTYQTPRELDPFDFLPFVAALPPDQAEKFAKWLTTGGPGGKQFTPRQDLVEGLKDEYAQALRAVEDRSAAAHEHMRVAWRLAAALGVAESLTQHGDGKRGTKRRVAAIDEAMKSRLAMPQAIGLALDLVARFRAGERDLEQLADLFLFVLGATIATDKQLFEQPGVMARFDEAIDIACEVLLRAAVDDGDADRWRVVSIALDLLRSRRLPSLPALLPRTQESPSPVDEGMFAIADTIGRIRAALTRQTDACVVGLHRTAGGCGFLTLRGGAHPVFDIDSGGFAAASASLKAAADDAPIALQAGVRGADVALSGLARTAYAALPDAVRQAIEASDVVLLIPDFRADLDEIPFELLHDGDGFLGERRIVARLSSFVHAARVLDSARPRSRHKRALVTAVSETLRSAAFERAEVARSLTASGYDAPAIAEDRLTEAFLTDRLSYVDVLHIAAHGEAAAGRESLLLTGGKRLVVDDLLRRPQRSMPLVFLNTCELARTRYLGAGLSRGIAYTFIDLGSPAVIASGVEVVDEATARVAYAFYDRAVNAPVGQALRDARRHLASSLPPAIRGRTVLFGDPWHTLPTAAAPEREDVVSTLLDGFFTPTEDDNRRVLAHVEGRRSLEADPEQPRLAAAFKLLEAVQALGDGATTVSAAECDSVIALADAVEHLPAMALCRLIKAMASLDAGESDARALLDDAARHLAPLAEFDRAWLPMLTNVRAKSRRIQLAAAGLTPRVMGPAGAADDGLLDAALDTLLGTQAGMEEEVGAVALKPAERSVEDTMWNAVVIGHPNRFEDAREIAAYCRQLGGRLIDRGYVRADAAPYVPRALMGLLSFLWSTQKTTYLEPELAAGQAGTAVALVKDLNAHWAPPAGRAAWFESVSALEEDVDATLRRLQSLKWETIYDELDPEITRLAKRATDLLATIGTEHAELLPSCAAVVTGLFVDKNTFSPLQGSVPESFDERLTRVFHDLSGGNQERFFPLLTRGFERVRTKAPDELERWRMERPADDRPPEGRRGTANARRSSAKEGGSKHRPSRRRPPRAE